MPPQRQNHSAEETTLKPRASEIRYGAVLPMPPPPPPPLPLVDNDPNVVVKESDELVGYTDRDARLPATRRSSGSWPSSSDENSSNFRPLLIKTQSSFWEDAKALVPGTIPHSIVVGTCIGIVCGVAAWIYYLILFRALDYIWHVLPTQVWVPFVPAAYHVLWIPLIGFTCAVGVGLTVKFLGEPGDLPYTIRCVHEQAYVHMSHVMPMVVASQCSILGGGSLGPEAPLVAICAALGGYISRKGFGVTERNLVRKHTLMGMAGALAAFFGCPLGGSMFALEVNSRFGIEYFEHTMEAIFAGEVCLVVFRSLAGLPIEAIWHITDVKLPNASALEILYGAVLGLLGAFVAWLFATFHVKVMGTFGKHKLLDKENVISRACVGAVVVVVLGMLVPHTMFWGEFEFQTIATMGTVDSLSHIWPTSGLLGFEMTGFWTALLVGITKLIAISFTVSGGYRGGYIFPAFAAAAALGRAIYCIFPFVPVQLCVLCMAAGLNVALTRTALATTLILAYLSGDQNTISAILCSSLVSLFATGYMPFIRTQMVRADLDSSLYYSEDQPEIDECGHGEGDSQCRKHQRASSDFSTAATTPSRSGHKTWTPLQSVKKTMVTVAEV